MLPLDATVHHCDVLTLFVASFQACSVYTQQHRSISLPDNPFPITVVTTTMIHVSVLCRPYRAACRRTHVTMEATRPRSKHRSTPGVSTPHACKRQGGGRLRPPFSSQQL